MKKIQWMHLSTSLTLKLINEYRKRPCLWNLDCNEHKSSMHKRIAWMEIANEIQLNQSLCERKMKSLIAQYQRASKRIVQLRRSGVCESEIPIPKWFAYSSMTFLDRPYRPISLVNRKHIKKVAVAPIESTAFKLHPNVLQANTTLELKPHITPTFDRYHPQPVNFEIKPISPPAEIIPNEPIEVLEPTEQIQENHKNINTFLPTHNAEPTQSYLFRDEYTSFGEVIASKIRKLPTEYEKNYVQREIFCLLFNASLGNYRMKPSNNGEGFSRSLASHALDRRFTNLNHDSSDSVGIKMEEEINFT